MSEETKNKKIINNDEIDLIDLAKTIWNGRRFIIVTVVLFACIGLAIALLTPKEYTASTTVVPQVSDNSSKMGGLSSLAAMAGFNLNTSSSSSELSPMLYPQIISSVPFQLEVMNTPFVFPNQPDPISIYTYFTEIKKPRVLELAKKYTLGLPFVILKAIKGDAPKGTNDSMANDLLSLTEDQE
jgi:hypothetical protein